MKNTIRDQSTLKTLVVGFEMIEMMRRHNGMTAAELTEQMELSQSAVYNYLSTLRQEGWVVKDGEEYNLSLKFLIHGRYVREHNLIYQTAKPHIEELAEETGEAAHLSTLENGNKINLFTKVSDSAQTRSERYHRERLQHTYNLHNTAMGKSILAQLDEDEARRILSKNGFTKSTENTITDMNELFNELEKIRERGYSFNREEELEGLRGVGAPVFDSQGDVLAAISVSGPKSHLKGKWFNEELPETVVNTTSAIELDFNMQEKLDNKW